MWTILVVWRKVVIFRQQIMKLMKYSWEYFNQGTIANVQGKSVTPYFG